VRTVVSDTADDLQTSRMVARAEGAATLVRPVSDVACRRFKILD